MIRLFLIAIFAVVIAAGQNGYLLAQSSGLRRLKYNQSELVVDLGVGLWAWPLPMDYDGDGRMDLVVCCPDKPYNGTYLFKNPGGPGENARGNNKFPVFKPAVRVSKGIQNVQVSYIGGRPRVLSPGFEYADFLQRGLDHSVKLPLAANPHGSRVRANQWKYCDFDGDGLLDIIVGVGDWAKYGWDDAFDKNGLWTRGPLHGPLYLLRNSGTTQQPSYEKPSRIKAAGSPIDVYGRPSPNLADFDGDGDLDIICGEFLDKFTYFENTGSRTVPQYAAGRRLHHNGKPIAMDLQMTVPVAVDWDQDGDTDLVVGDEDGRVALIEHTGRNADGLPAFLPPRYFQQAADTVKFGALATPCGFDWDGDGDEDILCGNTAGYIGFIENLGTVTNGDRTAQRWAAPELLKADGQVIRIQAGSNGSIQGPCEAKWGYTTFTVGDWDHDGLSDIVANSIWGKVIWFRNIGSRSGPKLAAGQPLTVHWPDRPPKPAWNWWDPEDGQLVTQWRTTPVVVDFNGDDLNDLVMLDHEGYLALFARQRVGGQLELLPGRRVFVDDSGKPIRLNAGRAGRSGRRKLAVADWDGDGRLDLLVNSQNADWYRNVATRDGKYVLQNKGPLDPRKLSGHTTSPTVVDWNEDGLPDLLVGGEDGFLYYLENPHKRH